MPEGNISMEFLEYKKKIQNWSIFLEDALICEGKQK